MRTWVVLLVLVGCGSGEPDDPCSTTGDGVAVDLHTTEVGVFLDPLTVDANAVALQDGGPECPFTGVPGAHTGHYALAVHHDRYAVAVTCPGNDVRVLARGIADGETLEVACKAPRTVGGGNTLFAHATSGGQPIVVQTFMGLAQSSKVGIADGGVMYQWRALAGAYDLVARGHVGDTNINGPDTFHILRDIAVTDATDKDVTPAVAPDWVAPGPTVAVSIGANSLAAMSYRTKNGTRVELGLVLADATPESGTLSTWPASLRGPDEVHIQTLQVDGAGTRRTATRDVAEPTAFDMAMPPELTASLTAGAFALQLVPDASRYVFSCETAKHAVTTDLTPAWLGDELAYTLPALAGVSYADCTMWTGTAIGQSSPTDRWESKLSIAAH
jgi:hypothetical protein